MEEKKKYKVIEVAEGKEIVAMEVKGYASYNTLLAMAAYGTLRNQGVKIEDIPHVADILKAIAEIDIKA